MPSTIETLAAEPRTGTGTTACRRLRSEGLVPCNVYGHKEGAVPITLTADLAHALVHGGTRVLDLQVGDKQDTVLVKEIQWDTFSKHIMHIDFVRVDANEKVQLEVPVILRGTAPGVVAGGSLEQPNHAVEIECLAVEVPDNIQVRVSALEIGQYIHVSDLEDLPKGVVVTSPPETVLAHVIDIKAEEAAADAADEAEEAAEASESPEAEEGGEG